MKKFLVLILATIVILTLIAGCSKQETIVPPEVSTWQTMVTTPPAAMSIPITTVTAPPVATSIPEKTVATQPPVQTGEAPLADPISTRDGLVSGTVIGEKGQEIHVYKGIPYAAPPVGNLRWRPPQSPAPWTGVRQCLEYSALASQQDGFASPDIKQSEDCLYLNVQTPAKKASDKLPVMVWMHEGGYSFGSGNEPGTNLPGLAQHGVLLVTVNMRLGALGLLTHPLLSKESPNGVSGNYMFLDMIAALKWVQTNIVAFGGDPGNITIFGESGGGAKVATLMASPLAKGLFHRAIMESAAISSEYFLPDVPLKDAEALGQKLFATLGVEKEVDPLVSARALPWKNIITALAATPLTTTVDGWFLPEATANIFKAGWQNPVPFITVANLGEITGPGIPMFLFPNLIPGYTNMLANSGKAGVKGYAAIFEHVPTKWKNDGAVAAHMMEIPYVFGDMNDQSITWKNLTALTASAKQGVPILTIIDRQLSTNMMEMWTQFARTGYPNVLGLVEWPAYSAAGDKYLALDVPLQVKSGFSLIAQPPKPTTTGVYSWEEAIKHIGETATVTGPIIDSKDLASMGFDYMVLGMGKKWGEPGYVGIALRVDRAKIKLDLYNGKTISATGRIYSTLTGSAAVEITDLANIKVK